MRAAAGLRIDDQRALGQRSHGNLFGLRLDREFLAIRFPRVAGKLVEGDLASRAEGEAERDGSMTVAEVATIMFAVEFARDHEH